VHKTTAVKPPERITAISNLKSVLLTQSHEDAEMALSHTTICGRCIAIRSLKLPFMAG
jgi:hypothetical protein